MTSIDVDGVAQRLECEERDADGQEYVEWLEVTPNDVGQRLGEEVGVLEVGKQREVEHYAQGEPQAREPATVAAGVYGTCNEEVAHGDCCQQVEVYATRFVVEVVGKERNEQQSEGGGATHECIHCHETQEQPQEEAAAEDERLGWVVGELL